MSWIALAVFVAPRARQPQTAAPHRPATSTLSEPVRVVPAAVMSVRTLDVETLEQQRFAQRPRTRAARYRTRGDRRGLQRRSADAPGRRADAGSRRVARSVPGGRPVGRATAARPRRRARRAHPAVRSGGEGPRAADDLQTIVVSDDVEVMQSLAQTGGTLVRWPAHDPSHRDGSPRQPTPTPSA